MERSPYEWTMAGGARFDEDGPEARDRAHRAAMREVRPKRTLPDLAGLVRGFSRPRPAGTPSPECCAAA